MNNKIKELQNRIDELEGHLVDTNNALVELYQVIKSGDLYRLTIVSLMNKRSDLNSSE